MIAIGRTIRRLRIERQVSQQALAFAAEVTPSFLSLIENDRRKPSLLVIQKLASALDVSEEFLIWDSIEIPENLTDSDKRICNMAKMIVREMYEFSHEKRQKIADSPKKSD